jgi:3-phosphoshikimate 1-carboxyvinyltransferase
MGVDAEELPDGMAIPGRQRFRAAEFDSFGDHRIAMAFAVAGMFAEGETVIQDVDCVATSYPGFEKMLSELANPKGFRTTTPVISSLSPLQVEEE